MILTMTLIFDLDRGRYSILAGDDWQLWIMEREWKFNRPHVSAVPRDEYTLERHNGTKYKNTWALIGDGVGHHASEGKPRSACVIHKALWPTDLEGCLAAAYSIGTSGEAIDSDEATKYLLGLLSKEDTHQVLMQY